MTRFMKSSSNPHPQAGRLQPPTGPRRVAAIAVGAALLGVLLLLGCTKSSKDTPAQAAAVKVNPCSMLSSSDIQAAVGAAPIGQAKRDNMGMEDDCDWTMPNGGDLHLTFFYTPVPMGTPQVSPQTKRDAVYETIAGLGSQAVYKNDSSPVIPLSESVEVVSGQQHFDVHYVNASTAKGGPSKDALIASARAVIAHLH